MSTVKATPFLEEMLQLVTQFLRKAGYSQESELVEQQFALPAWAGQDNPLLKKGLAKIVKEYVKNTPKIQKYYETRCEDNEDEEEEGKNCLHTKE